MKIAYISNNARIPSRDANSIHLMQMCATYAQLGHKVTLYVSTKSDADLLHCKDVYAHYGVANNFKIKRIPVPTNKIGSLLSTIVITPFLVFLTFPNIVHSRNLASAWSAAKLFRLPTIYELHDAPDKNPRALKMFKEFSCFKKSKAIVVITKALRDYVKLNLFEEAKIIVAPDGVDESIIIPNRNSFELRKQLNLPIEKKIAIYTGHLYPGKGMELIFEIAPKTENYIFYIIGGKIADVNNWKKICSDIDNIVFLGFQPPSEVNKFQAAADVLLLPNANKVSGAGAGNIAAFTSPLKMFEYMSSARPILSSKLPVLAEILVHEHNALMLDYNDPNEWVLALNKLDKDVEYGNELGRNAFEDVKKYTWQKRAFNILKQIEDPQKNTHV